MDTWWCPARAVRAGLLLGAILSANGCGPRADSGTEVARQLDLAIRAEVPATASRAQSEAWLDGRALPHSYIAGPPGDRYGQDTMPALAGIQDGDVAGTVRSMISCPNPATGVSDSGRLQIYFFFDRGGACIGHLVFWFEYSL